MNEHLPTSVALRQRVALRDSTAGLFRDANSLEELLPFTVSLVRSRIALQKAVQIRHAAYARHVPVFAESLRQPESTDSDDGVVVLLAESKLDGTPLGTMRIQTNCFAPLSVEQSIELPSSLRERPLAEATRLGVTDGHIGRVVKSVLFKAYYQYCLHAGIEWMVIAGRSPIDRQYDRLLFNDVYPNLGYVPLRHANNMPHRIMSFEIATARARWTQANHPLLGFMCETHHPDIDITGVRPSLAQQFALPQPADAIPFSM